MSDKPEFSRPIAIEGITPDKTRHETVEATKEERAALAMRFDLRELENLKATLDIRRVAGGSVIKVEGDFDADVVQTCVVSLQDVHAHLKGHFETFFTEDQSKFNDDPDLADDGENTPEMISNGLIDLGEVTAQYMALELDPYPRAPGVSLAAQMAKIGVPGKESPFRVLEGLKSDKKEKD